MAAGTIPLSMTQQLDIYGDPLAGGQLYIITAGTVSTPQDAFQDTALTIKQPYPMTLDAAGRVPQFFLDNSVNSTVKIRLQDKNGVVQLAADQVLVIGPSSGGGGGGGAVDPTQLIQTGNMIFRYGVGTLAGYVRLNNLTIGSATSGGTERANADCQALFQYLWGVDSSLAVSGGRGANALADWTANKQIALPDWRGYNLSALDDMGNSPSGRLSLLGAVATTLGGVGGSVLRTLGTSNLPPYTPSGSIGNGAITSTFTATAGQSVFNSGASGSAGVFGGTIAIQGSSGTVSSTQGASTFTGNAQGGTSDPFSVISPRKLCTFYIKLAVPFIMVSPLIGALCEKLGT